MKGDRKRAVPLHIHDLSAQNVLVDAALDGCGALPMPTPPHVAQRVHTYSCKAGQTHDHMFLLRKRKLLKSHVRPGMEVATLWYSMESAVAECGKFCVPPSFYFDPRSS